MSLVNTISTASYFSTELLDHIPLGIIALDKSLSVVAANSFAIDKLEIRPEQGFASTIHPDSQANFKKVLSTPGSDFQIQLLGANGTHQVQMRVLESAENGDRVLSCSESSTQILPQSESQESDGLSREFLHKISNSLTSVTGYFDLLGIALKDSDVLKGNSRLKGYLEKVADSLENTSEIVNDYRQYRRSVVEIKVPQPQKHVIVVDDEKLVVGFLAELMRLKNHKVTAFTESIKALEFYKREIDSVDLVILDQNMPAMDGISLAREMLSLNIKLPIIVCTGDENLIQEQASGHVNVKHFVKKPIDINELLGIMSDIFDVTQKIKNRRKRTADRRQQTQDRRHNSNGAIQLDDYRNQRKEQRRKRIQDRRIFPRSIGITANAN